MNIVSAILVGGFIVIAVIGHVLVLHAVLKGWRNPLPPRASRPPIEASKTRPQLPTISARKHAA